MVVVGALNVALGLVSLLTDRIELSPGVAGGLIVAGVVLAAGGVLVWRGSRAATLGWLAVFVVLFNLQLVDAASDAGDPTAVPDQPVPRLVVLGLLVVSLAVAAWRRRRTRRASA